MKALLIAEKPSLMRDIERVYRQMSFPDDITFKAVAGHVLELQQPEEYDDKWGGKWNSDVLPMIPESFVYKPTEKMKDLYNDIKKELKSGKYDYVINACDAGREGELIFYSLYKTVGVKLPVKRYWATNPSDSAVKKALTNLIDDSEPSLKWLKASSQYRAYFDWLIGMNFTRAMTVSSGATVKVGRVMTPTLALIVQRELEIRNFKPTTYYEVEADFGGKYKGTWFSLEDKTTQFDTKEDAQGVIAKSGTRGVVDAVMEKEVSQKAPTLFSLTELQKVANTFFGYTADETLAIAQSLYETRKLLTYPRTESKFLPKDMVSDIPKHLEAIKDIDEVKSFASKVISDKAHIAKVLASKDYVDDAKVTDHHAILPTDVKPNMASLSEKEFNIYLLVVKRFLSIFLPPYKVMNTTIVTDANGEKYKTTGKVVLDKGYTALFDGGAKDVLLPKLNKGDCFSIDGFELLEKQTTPPQRYDDSTLISAMENAGKSISVEELRKVMRESAGLGTPATRGEILKKLIKDEVAERRGKGKKQLFHATDKGIAIIQGLGERDIVSPRLTAEWELKLRKIEEGEYAPSQFYKEMIEYIKKETEQYKSMKANIQSSHEKSREVIGNCPKCGEEFVVSDKFYLCSKYKNGCDFIFGKTISGAKITTTNAKKLITGQTTSKLKFKYKSGKEGEAMLTLADDKSLKFVFGDAPASTHQSSSRTDDTPISERQVLGKCPKCGDEVVEGNDFYVCKGFGDGCDFNLKKTIKGGTVDKEDVQNILSGKPTKLIKFVWGNGKQGEAQLKYTSKLEFIFPSS